MIENIILDIGGIIIDDSDKNLEKVLNKSKKEIRKISKIAFTGGFRQCLLGNLDLEIHKANVIENNPDIKEDIDKILSPSNFCLSIPIFRDTLDLILKLKENGYNIYFLSNITKETYEYIQNIIDKFDGGLFSYKEHLVKPNEEFYNRLIKKYNLIKEKTIFFDDKLKNVEVGNKIGIKSIEYKSKYDIIDALRCNK